MHEDELHALIGRVYDAATDPDAWQPVLGRLQDALAADQLILWLRCPAPGRPGRGVGRDVDMGPRIRPEGAYWHGNPWQRAMPAVPTGSVTTLERLVPSDELLRTDFYQDHIRPLGVLHGLVGMLDRKGAQASTLCAWREARAPVFEDGETQLVRILLPHLRRAVRIADALRRGDETLRAVQGALDRLDLGVLVCDPEGRVLAKNELGEALLRRGDALQLRGGALRARTPAATRTLKARLAEASGTGHRIPRAGAVVLAREDASAVHLLATPLAQASLPSGLRPAGATAALFVRPPEPWRPLDRRVLRQLYGLTPTEARVAALLAEGRTLRQVAEALEVRITTARAHLGAVFDKTGTRRQAELVRLLVGGFGPVRAL